MNDEAVGVPAIDMHAITQLAEGDDLGDQFVVDVIDVFLTDLAKRVSAIRMQVSARDCAATRATAHAIKGSCSHFGAARLMDLSGEVEALAKRELFDDLQPAIDSMIAETERVRAALEAYRSTHAP